VKSTLFPRFIASAARDKKVSMIIVGDDALLAAQILPVKDAGGKITYMAMVSVSMGKEKRGADQGQRFDTPNEALDWLRQCLMATNLPERIEPPKA
jgi:hypothetical protein